MKYRSRRWGGQNAWLQERGSSTKGLDGRTLVGHYLENVQPQAGRGRCSSAPRLLASDGEKLGITCLTTLNRTATCMCSGPYGAASCAGRNVAAAQA